MSPAGNDLPCIVACGNGSTDGVDLLTVILPACTFIDIEREIEPFLCITVAAENGVIENVAVFKIGVDLKHGVFVAAYMNGDGFAAKVGSLGNGVHPAGFGDSGGVVVGCGVGFG